MTRFDILSRIPPEPRGLIRQFIGTIEDVWMIPGDNLTEEKTLIEQSCRTSISGLLGLWLSSEEIESAMDCLLQKY